MNPSNEKLKKYAGLLNDAAPKGEFLAFINPQESELLKKNGALGLLTDFGVPSYRFAGGYQGGAPGNTGATSSSSSGGGNTGGGNTGGGGGSGGGGDSGDAREQYAAKQTATGFVGGGGAVTYTGGDKDDPSSYTVADSYVTPEQIQRETEKYEEQFGGIAPLGSRPVDYKTRYEYNQIKTLQQSKLDNIIGKLKRSGYDIDWDASLTDVKDFIDNISTDEMADSYKDLDFYNQDTIEKYEKYGYIPQSTSLIETQFPYGVVTGANILGAVLPSKPITKDELLADLETINEIGQSQGQMSWDERLEKYSPKQYETITGSTYDPITKTYTKKDSGGADIPIDSSQSSQSLIQPLLPQQPSMVNRYFSTIGMSGQSPLSSNLQTSYNNAKNTMNNILGINPTSQQFGYSTQPYGGLMASNLTTNPYNIDYLRRLGLI